MLCLMLSVALLTQLRHYGAIILTVLYLCSTFGTASTGTPGEETREEERINIFSLASGHLYERFIRIMMLSVLKHTKSPVKFWFLKNYLSPTFKVCMHCRQ